MTKRLMMLFVLPALIATACSGGNSSEGVASLSDVATDDTSNVTLVTEVDTEESMMQFAQCMRDHGIDMEDPTVDENGNVQFGGFGPGGGGGDAADRPDRDVMQAAMEDCGQYLEGTQLGFQQIDQTELQDRMLEFSQCMRDNGYEMDDIIVGQIQPGQGGEPGEGGRFGFEPDDPDFQAAFEVCGDILGDFGLGRGLGGGPGAPPPGDGQ